MGDSVDYLVVGAGASAMAFVDSVFHASASTFAIVDRRHAPGGHWNDAYPYVSLHQPATSYGVASRPLSTGAWDISGTNAGLQTLASGVEVAGHFHAFMREVLLPSGRVRFLPMTEHVGDGECVSTVSGERQRIEARVVVDATVMETSIPLTHRRRFAVADGVVCIPPNDLPRQAAAYRRFCVLGAGKTGLDAVSWLLAAGVAADAVTWVVPRDPWMAERASVQPGVDGFRSHSGRLFAAQMEAIAAASDLEDMGERLEAAGVWLRLDPAVTPTMHHCGSIARAELDEVRRVRDVVRLGRVTAVEADRLVLERGERALAAVTLVIDCTASALERSVGKAEPVFAPGRIALQMIRFCQPNFSSALIGHMEATIDDLDEKRELAVAVPMPDTPAGWARGMAQNFVNQRRWSRRPELREWLAACRLNFTGAWAQVPAEDVESTANMARAIAAAPAAAANLQRFADSAPDDL